MSDSGNSSPPSYMSYEMQSTCPDPDSLRVIGDKVFHRQFTPDESSAMSSEKSVKSLPAEGEGEQAVKKVATNLADVDVSRFVFADPIADKKGLISRKMNYLDGAIVTPWLFTQWGPSTYGDNPVTGKRKYTISGSFMGVDENWSLGDEYPPSCKNKDDKQRHDAYGKTKEMDEAFKVNVLANQHILFKDPIDRQFLDEPGNVLPIAKRNYNKKKRIRFSPSLKGTCASENIKVFKLNSINDPMPSAPNSSIREFESEKGKFFIRFLFEIERQRFPDGKGYHKEEVTHDIMVYGITYCRCGVNDSKYDNYTY